MQCHQLHFDTAFRPVCTVGPAQAAELVLEPGASTGGPGNRHRGADQWIFVVSGEGQAVVDGHAHALRGGTLLVIERGETHELRCEGAAPLRLLSLYAPPAYDARGERLPSGEAG